MFMKEKVKDFIKKWGDLKVLDKKCASYIKPSNSKPGTMYGLIKTHKENNPASDYKWMRNSSRVSIYLC